ncbi:MAG: 50S ribosomal protein L10 [Ignavibacteria bacterium]|jgi:large subunit ribosomal protein L10|nr:50S ribosomal protein L10 [Ignavibacteria bacterium]
MIKLDQKKEIVADLVELLKPATGIYFVDFAKLTVKETTDLRKEFNGIGARMRVAKNTLIIRAIAEIDGLDVPEPLFFGQTAIIIAGEDATAPAKIIKKIFDKTERLRLKAALIEGQLYEGNQLNLVASLPSRAELMAGILGSLQSPISGIVGSINAVMRDLSSIIEEVAKKKAA